MWNTRLTDMHTGFDGPGTAVYQTGCYATNKKYIMTRLKFGGRLTQSTVQIILNTSLNKKLPPNTSLQAGEGSLNRVYLSPSCFQVWLITTWQTAGESSDVRCPTDAKYWVHIPLHNTPQRSSSPGLAVY